MLLLGSGSFSLSLSVCGVKVLLTDVHSFKDIQEKALAIFSNAPSFILSSFRIDPLKRSVGALLVVADLSLHLS